jgi:hypothetical protein
LAKGLAEYRQERFASATDWMQQVLSRAGPTPERDAAAWLVLALAQHQLKQTNEAGASLAKGREIIEAKLPKLDSGNLGEDWDDLIIAHALLDEAKALIEGQTNTTAEKKSDAGKFLVNEAATAFVHEVAKGVVAVQVNSDHDLHCGSPVG